MDKVLFKKTDKAFISDLPRFIYEGSIVVVQGEAVAERAVRMLRGFDLLGIDTETRPSFQKGVNHKVALLQIACEEVCFLFRLNEMGFVSCLCELLSDACILKVGLSLKDDFHMLWGRNPRFQPAGFVEIQTIAAEMGIEDMSLQKLYANVFHRRISKSMRLSNWEAEVLSEAQRTYAATDAFSCIQLYKELVRLQEQGGFVVE